MPIIVYQIISKIGIWSSQSSIALILPVFPISVNHVTSLPTAEDENFRENYFFSAYLPEIKTCYTEEAAFLKTKRLLPWMCKAIGLMPHNKIMFRGPSHEYEIINHSMFYYPRHGLPSYASILEFPVVFVGERHCVSKHFICSV